MLSESSRVGPSLSEPFSCVYPAGRSVPHQFYLLLIRAEADPLLLLTLLNMHSFFLWYLATEYSCTFFNIVLFQAQQCVWILLSQSLFLCRRDGWDVGFLLDTVSSFEGTNGSRLHRPDPPDFPQHVYQVKKNFHFYWKVQLHLQTVLISFFFSVPQGTTCRQYSAWRQCRVQSCAEVPENPAGGGARARPSFQAFPTQHPFSVYGAGLPCCGRGLFIFNPDLNYFFLTITVI